jgi:transcriptional regulator GlxA family with amidase domain
MPTVSILALQQSVPASITDAAYVFAKVNQFLQEADKPALFTIQTVGFTEQLSLNNGSYLLRPDTIFSEVVSTDLIIIPSFSGNASAATYLNKDCATWIATQYKNGAEVASLCTGAFLLAFSGILKGKKCTTHWAYANEFKYFYPSVTLVDEKVITDQDGLYSSAGSNAYWNLLIHLVEKYAGWEMAVRTAKYFVIDLDKRNQSPFVIFQGLKDHTDTLILQTQQFIEQNYAEKLTVEQLAEQFFLTRRTFERRFKKATRHTLVEYIQRVKIEAVKKQIEIGRKTINEIMLDVGYSDVKAFRDLFKKISGLTPVAYKNKYHRK